MQDPEQSAPQLGGGVKFHNILLGQLEAQKLPLTQGALHEAISRAHYQAMVWYQDDIPHLQLPPPTNYGWKEEGDGLVPVPTRDPPAPATVTHLIKCGCN